MGFLFDSTKKYKNQDYQGLKKESQTKGTLFIDPEFPPDDRSLSSTPGKFGNVVWKRPKVRVSFMVMVKCSLSVCFTHSCVCMCVCARAHEPVCLTVPSPISLSHSPNICQSVF